MPRWHEKTLEAPISARIFQKKARWRILTSRWSNKQGETLEVSRENVDFSIVRPGETILPEDAPATLVS